MAPFLPTFLNPYDILITKLNAYDFDGLSLQIMQGYLNNRQQRIKINSRYSSWEEVLFGDPQGSILGLLLFNIDMYDMFLKVEGYDIVSYADDNTPFSGGKMPLLTLN